MSKTQIPTGGIADDAISEEHIDATAITGHTALAEAPADTDEFLISDGGTLKRIDASYIGGGSFVYLGGVNSADVNAVKISLQQVFANDYRRYKVLGKFEGTSNGAEVEFRWLKSDNSEMTGSNYYGVSVGSKATSSSLTAEQWIDWQDTKIRLFRDTSTGTHVHSFEATLFPNQNENVDYPTALFSTQSRDYNSNNPRIRCIQMSAWNEFTTSIAGGGIQFESTSGNFGKANFSIWGLKDS